ncbi:SH3 domain-containing protein [Oricola nitratireducens]|uniref:SH3 domain-containing protein n=1 Tax=Oricola nitratireducens TaxID=2775868 RepID=UPI001868D051|nr:SH3 domain-containing protein [Oricola nitratireducens]
MSSMSWETTSPADRGRAARSVTRRPAARRPAAERPAAARPAAAGPADGNRTGRIAAIGLVALFGVAALVLLIPVLLRGGGPAPQETAPQTAATAEQSAAEPVAAITAPTPAAIEQPALPAGSVRFAGSEAPAATAPDRPSVDTARTASILSPATDVAVAETEQQAVEMESRLAAAGARDFKVPDNDPAAVPVTVASATASPAEPFPPVSDLKPGRAAKWVNLRAGPDNDAAVLAVVPYDAAILTQPDCPHWCAVVYDGRQGYIYKAFVVHPGATAGG